MFTNLLYPDSPFLPTPDIGSLFRLIYSATALGQHPATAIAGESRLVFDEHGAHLNNEKEWISEKFGLSDRDSDHYYFGLFTPPTLILAAGMHDWLPEEEILENLIPNVADGLFDGVRDYVQRNLARAARLADFEAKKPMPVAKPIYDHCKIEVYSFSPWYQVGLEASERLYTGLARLYDYPPLSNTAPS